MLKIIPYLIFLALIFLLSPVRSYAMEITTEISLGGDGLAGFDIYKPTPGFLLKECSIGSEPKNPGVYINQWNNTQSLCNAAKSEANCKDADIVRANSTSRFCYWRSQDKIQVALNTQAMDSNLGCYINNPQDPGGYSIYLSRDFIKSVPDYWTKEEYILGKLKNLYLSTFYKTDYYSQGVCPSGVLDPLVGRDPIATAYVSLIILEIDPVTRLGKNTIFYQTVMYDNRSSWQQNRESYFNCSLPSSTSPSGVVVVGNPIGKWGLPMNLPGQSDKYYQWDVLNDIKTMIKKCFGPNVDFNNFRITGAYIGNELQNATIMTNTFTKPRMLLVRDSFSDLNNDGKVDIFDYNILVSDFGKTGVAGFVKSDINRDGKVDIFDYNILLRDFGK